MSKRLVIAITGATGAIYGVRLLQMLRGLPDWETHLIISQAAVLSIREELSLSIKEIEAQADVVYNVRDVGAAIASGSFLTEGMIVAPCSMKTLSAIANGYGDNLVGRAADVALKERRRLVLIVRETPLHLAHLKNMISVTEMGGVIYPPLPAFYIKPRTLDDIVHHTCARVLDLFGEHSSEMTRWSGLHNKTDA